MAAPYSMDLRERVLAKYDEAKSSTVAGAHFDVSPSWVRGLVARRRETGSFAPLSTAPKTSSRAYDAADEAVIRDLIREKPDVTLAEVVAHVGKPASIAAAQRAVARLGLPRKKSRRTPPSATGPTSWKSGRPGTGGSPG